MILPFRRQLPEKTACTVLKHMVKPESLPGKPDDKGIVFRHLFQKPVGIRDFRYKISHRFGKFIGRAQKRQKYFFRIAERINKSLCDHVVDIVIFIQKGTSLGISSEIQIDYREPSLTDSKKLFCLFFCDTDTTSVGVGKKVRREKFQFLCADMMDFFAKTKNVISHKEAVSAGDDQVCIFRQKISQCAEKPCGKGITKKMKVIQKKIRSSIVIAEKICQMFCQKNDFFCIIWITEFLYFRICCFQRGLKASPEQPCTVRINIYTKNLTVIFDRYLVQEPVNGSTFTISHRSRYRCERILRYCI